MAIYFDQAMALAAPEIADQEAWQLINADISPIDQFLPILEFEASKSPHVTNEVDTLTATTAVDNADVATDDTVSTFINPNRVHNLTLLVGDTKVGDFTRLALSYDLPQAELQRALQMISVTDFYKAQLWIPQLANSFQSFVDLLPGANNINLGGAAFTLNQLEQIYNITRENNGNWGTSYFVGNRLSYLHFLRLVRGEGWGPPQVVIDATGQPRAAFHGYPFLISDHIPSNEGVNTNETSIWCITVGAENNGVYGLYARDVGAHGWVRYEAGGVTDRAATEYRDGWICGLAVPHPSTTLARLSGIINPAL